MRYEVINEQKWGNKCETKVMLHAETKEEKQALKNFDSDSASESERELIDNYLTFDVRPPAGFQVTSGDRVGNGVFIVISTYVG